MYRKLNENIRSQLLSSTGVEYLALLGERDTVEGRFPTEIQAPDSSTWTVGYCVCKLVDIYGKWSKNIKNRLANGLQAADIKVEKNSKTRLAVEIAAYSTCKSCQ